MNHGRRTEMYFCWQQEMMFVSSRTNAELLGKVYYITLLGNEAII
jgi:hypothetical protein